MTTKTENQKNIARLLLPLVAVLVGSLLTIVAFVLASMGTGACHCSRPITVAFPFATLLWASGYIESLGGLLMAVQFPIYAMLVALGKSRAVRARIALLLLAIHVVAVIVGLLVYRG